MSSAWDVCWADRGYQALRPHEYLQIHDSCYLAPSGGSWEPVDSGCDLLQQLGILRIGLSSSGEKELGSLCIDAWIRRVKQNGTEQCADASHIGYRGLCGRS